MTLNGKEMREFDGTRVKIMVTSACNTACKHCCLGFSGTMAPDVLEEMISSLSPRYELRLDGSELLLDDRYVRLMKRIGQDNVLTNGRILLQKPERISLLPLRYPGRVERHPLARCGTGSRNCSECGLPTWPHDHRHKEKQTFSAGSMSEGRGPWRKLYSDQSGGFAGTGARVSSGGHPE